MALALILPTLAFAAVDLTKVPVAFCKPALAVSAETQSCGTNDTFIRASQDCLDKLNALESKLGLEASAIARTGAESQLSQTGTGGKEYAFSAAALAYLGNVAYLAYREIGEYPPYVFLPPDTAESARIGNPELAASRSSCFREPQQRIQEALQYLDRKMARYKARLAESKKDGKTLGTRATDFGSLTGTATASRGAGSGKRVPSGKANNGASSITGIEQDKAKQR